MPKKSIWALDIGAWSLKIARGRREKSGDILINMYDEFDYEALGVEGDGELLSGASEAMEEFANRYTVGPSDDLCVSVGGSGVFSRFINLPPVPESIDDIIQYEARQQIPFDMDQVVWDYQPVKESHEPWEEVKVGLFALKSETVDELMSILHPWRRNLRLVQQSQLAVYNCMSVEGYDSESAVIVDLGAKTTGVVVIDPPEFWLRSLLVGSDSLTKKIESHFGVSKREAERIKERAGESGRSAQLLRVVGKPVGNILSEIQRSLGYYKTLSPEVKLDKIVGVGNGFRLKGVDKVIAEGLQSEVKVFDELDNIVLSEEVEEAIGDGLCGCCALFGLIAQRLGEGRVKVNMVPEDIAFENEMRAKKPFLAGAVAGLMLIVCMLIIGEMLYGSRLAEHENVGAGIPEELQNVEREYDRVRSDVQEIKSELELLSVRSARRDKHHNVLSEFTNALPQGRILDAQNLLPAAVYIRDLRLRWVKNDVYERVIDDDEVVEMESERDLRRRSRQEPERRDDTDQEIPPAGFSAVAGEDAVLALKARCESTVVRMRYLQEVVSSLERARYADTGERVFRDVRLVGTPGRIFRDSMTGELVTDSQAIHFLQFELFAGVNQNDDEEDAENGQR